MSQPLESFKYFYLIGVGGIGMSALARYFNFKGGIVSGYDREASHLTRQLESEGIIITYNESVESIPKQRIGTPDDTLVVYTPAVPQSHSQLQWFRERDFTILKRAQVLGMITRSARGIAVAGTHGKTTTTALVTHILRHNGYDVSAFIGGISTNYNTNFLFGKSNTVVIEADEYDRSFLKLRPYLTVITSTDPDHLDIYKDQDGVRQAFAEFAEISKKNGRLLSKINLPVIGNFTYGLIPSADYFAYNIAIKDGHFTFSLHLGDGTEVSTFSLVPGIHNVENAVAAAGICHLHGLNSDQIASGIQTFKGVKRRFEIVFDRSGVTFIDDYAHHPAELEALLKSTRMLYPGRKITIFFQPHLYSRTRDFHIEFARSLSLADRVILLDIYPAREDKIRGVSEDLIYRYLSSVEKYKILLTDLYEFINHLNFKNEVLITAGAGNISDSVEILKSLLNEKVS